MLDIKSLKGRSRKRAEKRQPDEGAGLREELSKRYDFSRIIGESGPMQQIYEQIAQIACTKTTVLITGESGTGKELVADALHINSPRAGKPFIKINCAALAENLIESELFGHERGSFTDAGVRRIGRFELADGGTLFLDEIGELGLSAQVKLMRVLQNKEFERLGGTQTVKVDVRLIAATNRDLEKNVAGGGFHAGLYYRLNLFPIIVPPLRERREDILPLAEYFLAKYSRNQGQRRFSSQAVELLTSYDWPGNVRELENAIERAVVVADGKVVQHFHLPPALQTIRPARLLAGGNLFSAVDNYEKELICAALQTTRGKRAQAAELLGISDRVLSYKIKKHKIDCAKFR
jgi:Nif-specific regulatory protein